MLHLFIVELNPPERTDDRSQKEGKTEKEGCEKERGCSFCPFDVLCIDNWPPPQTGVIALLFQ